MRTALEAVYADAAKLSLPVLIFQGLNDRTTDPAGPGEWLRQAPLTDQELVEFDEGLHELLNDREWRAVCAKTLEWLDQRVRA
jgi:alpha-beta hydrolase superfamily lysophospholipase